MSIKNKFFLPFISCIWITPGPIPPLRRKTDHFYGQIYSQIPCEITTKLGVFELRIVCIDWNSILWQKYYLLFFLFTVCYQSTVVPIKNATDKHTKSKTSAFKNIYYIYTTITRICPKLRIPFVICCFF